MALFNKTCEKDSKRQLNWQKKLSNSIIRAIKHLSMKKKKIKMLKFVITKWHLMSTLTQLILGALQEMIHYWNGIDFCAEFMVVVDDRTCFIKPIQRQVFTKHKKLLRKPLLKVLTRMEKYVLFTMHMIITFVLLGMSLFPKMKKIKKILFL